MSAVPGPGTTMPPHCLPPRPARAPSTFRMPPGAWDTHAHVIGGGPDLPFVGNRSYTPPSASPDAYVAMLDRVGIAYGVVVAISVHGHDNRLIVDALKHHPTRLRGVVSIDGSEPDDELLALRDLGVCGIRLNEHFAGGAGADRLHRLAERCRPLGWHLDLGLSGARLNELAPALRRLGIRLVIDHMGFCPAEQGIAHPDFVAVLGLAGLEDCWIKLSGGYRLTMQPGACPDIAPFVQALCRAAPSRVVWASDWPNVALLDPARMPETGAQLETLDQQLGQRPGGAALLQAVLVDNPARLYGLPGTPAGDPQHP